MSSELWLSSAQAPVQGVSVKSIQQRMERQELARVAMSTRATNWWIDWSLVEVKFGWQVWVQYLEKGKGAWYTFRWGQGLGEEEGRGRRGIWMGRGKRVDIKYLRKGEGKGVTAYWRGSRWGGGGGGETA